MRQANDPDFDHVIQRAATNTQELHPSLERHKNPPTNATFEHLDKASRGVCTRASDVARTIERDRVDFAHLGLAWTGPSRSRKSAKLCVRNVSMSSINDRVQERVRAMPKPPAQHTRADLDEEQSEENEPDGVGASPEFPKPLNERGCPPHSLKLWDGSVCMVMRNLNADLKNGTRVILNHVSARRVRVVEPSAKVPALHTATSLSSVCTTSHASCPNGRSSVTSGSWSAGSSLCARHSPRRATRRRARRWKR